MTEKYSINLLQPELRPQKTFWTLNRVVGVWALTLIVMLAWIFVNQTYLSKLSMQSKQLTAQATSLKSRVASLEAKVKQHKADSRLREKIELLKDYLLYAVLL